MRVSRLVGLGLVLFPIIDLSGRLVDLRFASCRLLQRLHNGSVRTMHELLTSPAQRARTFHRGSRIFDEKEMGYTDGGAYVFDTAGSGNSNSGHDYGTNLSDNEKHDLMEYLKTV
jgi:hypothetical protein